MKKTDVTQPVAMATPFAEGVYSATSSEDFEIPAATSSTADDSCVMDDGFLPITSTALDDGGKAPERKNFNGMFYLSTDQRFFLQNGGFITYNPDVAAAIGGYPQDAILDFIDSNGNYKKVRSLIDDNSNNFVADETLIDGTNWEGIQMGGGSGYEVGDIVMRITPTNDAGKHLFDGALIQYGSYSAFVDYIAGLVTDYPNLFVTESDWQTAVATYGVCGKFVYDSVNNTVRLPKITGIVEGTTDLNALGDLIEAGLPNIEVTMLQRSQASVSGGIYQVSGAGTFSYHGDSTQVARVEIGNNASSDKITIDASLGNTIYGNSPTVQPQTIKVLYYIVIATTAKTDIEVDIDEITTDLNGKADVDGSNMVSSVKNFDGAWVGSLLTAFSNVTLSATPRTVDLSSYLPNDGYDYLVGLTILGKPNTAGIIAIVLGDYYTQVRTRGAVQNVNSEGSGYIVVGNDRTVQCSTITGTWTSAELRFFAYRRIGTNQ